MYLRIHSDKTITFECVIQMSTAFYEGTDQSHVIQCIRIRTIYRIKMIGSICISGIKSYFYDSVDKRGSTFTFMFRFERKKNRNKDYKNLTEKKPKWLIPIHSEIRTIIWRAACRIHISILSFSFYSVFVCWMTLKSFLSIWQTNVSAMEQT